LGKKTLLATMGRGVGDRVGRRRGVRNVEFASFFVEDRSCVEGVFRDCVSCSPRVQGTAACGRRHHARLAPVECAPVSRTSERDMEWKSRKSEERPDCGAECAPGRARMDKRRAISRDSRTSEVASEYDDLQSIVSHLAAERASQFMYIYIYIYSYIRNMARNGVNKLIQDHHHQSFNPKIG
jgi:hypothetical protein